MYEKILDVPSVIAEFYREDIRNEPTGEIIDHPYESIDDNGDPITLTRPVAKMHDVTYVVEVDKPRFESLQRLKMIVDKNSLLVDKRDFIDSSTQAVLDSVQWDWFELYKVWIEYKPVETEDKFLMSDGEGVVEFSQELFDAALELWVQSEPVRPPVFTVREYQVANFAFFRKYLPTTKQDEMRYDDAVNGTTTWIDHNADVKTRWPKQ